MPGVDKAHYVNSYFYFDLKLSPLDLIEFYFIIISNFCCTFHNTRKFPIAASKISLISSSVTHIILTESLKIYWFVKVSQKSKPRNQEGKLEISYSPIP